MVLEKTLESPLDCKEIQPVHTKGDQYWVFFGRTDVEDETPIVWPPDVKICLIWKDPDAGKDWGQEEKVTTEDEMAEWHCRLNAHEFVWTPGVHDGQGGELHFMGSQRVGHDWVTELNWSFIFSRILFKLTNFYVIIIWEKKKNYFKKHEWFLPVKMFWQRQLLEQEKFDSEIIFISHKLKKSHCSFQSLEKKLISIQIHTPQILYLTNIPVSITFSKVSYVFL